jgi:hypothetical protein
MQIFTNHDLGNVVVPKKSLVLESFHPLITNKFNHPIFEGECFLKS